MDKILEDPIKKVGTMFFSFAMKKMKNSKAFRDFKSKWVKDNYAEKTVQMFEAAIADAKEIFDLPEELLVSLLDDPINRDEVFRWIIEGVAREDIIFNRLNLEPYMERFPSQQDFLIPFFEMIYIQLQEYKDIHWDPEFLEVLNKLDIISGELKEIKNDLNQMTIHHVQIVSTTEETNNMLKSALEPFGHKDLSELIKEGKVVEARRKAEDRLNRAFVNNEDKLELNAVIASSYMNSSQEKESIPYLKIAISHCDDHPRKNRLLSLVNLYEEKYELAHKYINEAIEREGETTRNLEILANIYYKEENYEKALVILSNNDEDLKALRVQILLTMKKYEEVIEQVEQSLAIDPTNTTWLMMKAEALVLWMEDTLSKNKPVNTSEVQWEVIPVLEKLEYLESENPALHFRIRELKAATLFRAYHFSEAKVIYEELYREKKNSHFYNNYLWTSLCDGDFNRAILLLEEKVNKMEPNNDDITTLAKVLVDAGRPKEAITLLTKFSHLFKCDERIPLEYYFVFMDACFRDIQSNEAKRILDTLERETSDKLGVYVLKAYYFNHLHHWDKAIDYWEKSIHLLSKGIILNECKIQLSQAYINSEREENLFKLKEILVSIPNWFQHETLVNRYVHALFKLGEYKNIIDFCKRVPITNTYLQEVVSTIYYNFGWFEIAKEDYLLLFQQTNELEYLLRHADCLFRLGEIESSLSILQTAEIRVKKKGSMEDFNLLSIAYLNQKEYKKALTFAYETYLRGSNDPRAWGFFFAQMSQLSGLVTDVKEEWLKAYHKIIEEYSKQFPEDSRSMKQVQAIEDGKIADELKNELIKITEGSSSLLKLYMDNKLPLSFLTSIKKDPLQTWNYAVNETKLNIWSQTGEFKELIIGQTVAKLAVDVLLDINTLFTLHHLGLLEQLRTGFTIYIHQRQYELLHQEFMQLNVNRRDGLKFMSYENDRLVLTEVSPEQVKQTLSKLKELLRWINDHCIKVGTVIGNSKETKGNLSFLEAPIDLCKVYSFIYVIDSYTAKMVAGDIHGVHGFTTFELLNHLYFEKVINDIKYYDSISELLIMGHTLIPVNKEFYVYHIKKHNFKWNRKLDQLFNYLKKKEFSIEYVNKVVASLFEWIWLELHSTKNRIEIIERMCALFLVNEENSIKIITLLETNSIFDQQNEFLNYLHNFINDKNKSWK